MQPFNSLADAGLIDVISLAEVFLSSIQQLRYSLPVVESLYKELENYKKFDNFYSNKQINKFTNNIELKNINFSYNNSKEIIKDI